MNFKILLMAAALTGVQSQAVAEKANVSNKVTTTDEIEWGYLNPLRGDQSPGAADLWGDRTKNMATGMLVKFREGFSSPPHIHNITYRGVVIKGLLHNDDPKAEKMWLPESSFWVQPAGESHITAAGASENMAYIEIDSGPYLVKPTAEAFENGEKPINVDAANLVWLPAPELVWIDSNNSINSPQAAFLWGQRDKNGLNGSLIKLPVGFKGEITSPNDTFRAVVIQGEVTYGAEKPASKQLQPGSYFESNGEFKHQITTTDKHTEAIIYIRTNGQYQITD